MVDAGCVARLITENGLLETKIYLPKVRRGLVPRPRLGERLNRGAELKLTLVSAPAGFGKTTLLAGWLDSSRHLAAWVSLDQSDKLAASFWSYLIAALAETVELGVGASAISLLQSPQPPPIEAVLTLLLNDLSAISTDVMLVLDDYHVIDAREIHAGMLYLLDHLPAATPGDRQPHRPGAAAGSAAGTWRTRRSPRCICGSRWTRPLRIFVR